MKCLNFLCNNELPEYRIARQNNNMSKWYFCVPCLKYQVIRYGCFHCNKMIMEGLRNSPKFCSSVCKSRYNYDTKNSEPRTCKNCGVIFMSNLGYPQKFCSKECRITNGRKRKNFLARKRYKQINSTVGIEK